MPRSRRSLQLAPGSLALVLRQRREAAAEPSGAELFRAFRRANGRCHWDAGLVRAVSRVSLQGWLRGGVLLLQGPAAPIQRLRDSWLRRALRPPPGFLLRAVGDVSPIQMNPISQSQFVPLAEVLCCTISDMNAAHVIVTQETLMDHLAKHYPGIATPSQEILYSVLGTLIKERKIYHTGEGYFIVTPHTYFIGDNVMKDKKFLLEDNCVLLPSASDLVRMESCGGLTEENFSMVSHCRSCHCYPAQDAFTEQKHQQLIKHEPNGRGEKGSGELKPLVQNQPIITSVETHSCDTTKSLTSIKEKQKYKKFGLGLFRCRTSKKEKPKIKYSSFSAQFPPEEWPVRDEDNLYNIPRDIEHEIIKHINPLLTVDNLAKHTVLMKKLEEQKKYISKGTSTEMLTVKQKHISNGCIFKKPSKTVKHHRKVQSNKEKRIRKPQRQSQINGVISEDDKQEKRAECLSSHAANEVLAHEQLYEDATVVKSHFIYKKQIKNPFPRTPLPCKEKLSTKRQKGQKNSKFQSRIQKQEWNFKRSRFLDSSRTFDHKSVCSNAEKSSDKAKLKKLSCVKNSSLQPIKGHFSECSNYPQCSTLQTDDKCHYFNKSSLSDCVCQKAYKTVVYVPKTPFSYMEDTSEFKEEIKHPLSSKDTHPCEKPAIIWELLDQTSNEFQNFSLSNDPADTNQFKPSENDANQGQSTVKKNELMFHSITVWPQSLEKEAFTDDHILFQNVDDCGDIDACSSLYLEEEDYFKSYQQQPNHTISKTGERNKMLQKIGTEVSLENWGLKIHPVECSANINNRSDSYGQEVNECHSLTGSMDSPQEFQKISLAGESCFHNDLSQFVYKYHEEEVNLSEHIQASAVGGSIFDFCKRNKGDSDAETLQDTPNEMREKSACWTLEAQTMEMRKKIGKKQQLCNSTPTTISGPSVQQAPSNVEGTENHSIAGDSGIDSPRTQSLTSNNSVIFNGLKRRQGFLQNFEGINNCTRSLSQNTLPQLTPDMNV